MCVGIPTQQLRRLGLDNPSRKESFARRQESQTAPLHSPSRPEAWEDPDGRSVGTPLAKNLDFTQNASSASVCQNRNHDID